MPAGVFLRRIRRRLHPERTDAKFPTDMRPLPRPPGARHGLTRCGKGNFTCRRPPLSAMPSAGEGSLTCRAASRSAARAVLSPRLHAAAHPQRARRRPGGRAGGARRADAVTGHRRIGCRLPAPRRTHRASALPVLRQRTDARGGKPSAGAPSSSPARPRDCGAVLSEKGCAGASDGPLGMPERALASCQRIDAAGSRLTILVASAAMHRAFLKCFCCGG